MEENEIKVYSEQVQDVLSEPPKAIFRWGNTILLCFIFVLILLSYLIKYPDSVEGSLKLTTEIPPSKLVSQTDGYISNIYVESNQEVSKGDLIASIKNPISKESLDLIHQLISDDKGKDELESDRSVFRLKNIQNLGGLQTEVNLLVNSIIELKNLKNNSFFENSISKINEQINLYENLVRLTGKELKLLEYEVVNATEKYRDDSLLFAKNVIAKHRFYSSQSEYIIKKRQLIDSEKSYIQYKININNLESQKNEFTKVHNDNLRKLSSNVTSSVKNIQSFIASWQENFVLRAFQNGRISLLLNLSEGSFVKKNQELFALIPNKEEIVAIIKITDQGFGKVKEGQKVLMKFSNYPSEEFGQLIGTVFEVSSIPSEGGYLVKARLVNGLATTYHTKIEYRPEMLGVAEIVTEELRLIERIFNKFKNLLDE